MCIIVTQHVFIDDSVCSVCTATCVYDVYVHLKMRRTSMKITLFKNMTIMKLMVS